VRLIVGIVSRIKIGFRVWLCFIDEGGKLKAWS